MALYNCYFEFDEHDCLIWYVYENNTQQIVGKFLFEDEAVEYLDFLENGGSFAGFTPAFMLNRVRAETDINEAFAAEFA